MGEKAKRTRLVRWWLRGFRGAMIINGLIAVYGTIGLISGWITPTLFAFLLLATTAVVLSLVIATRLAQRGVSDFWFIKGTTTVRVIAFGWLLIGLGYVLAIPAVLLGIELDLTNSGSGVFGAIGAVALLAVIGPGFSEYREALRSLHPKDADAP
jgi:hypothetical protein